MKISFHEKENGNAGEYGRNYITDELSIALITTKVWSPIVWRSGVRRESEFESCKMCVLDFDNGTSLSEAISIFKNYSHIIGTTKSHGIKGDRFRVVLFFENTITDLQLYKHNMRSTVTKFLADRACQDGARFFFPCKYIVSTNKSGQLLPVQALPIVSQEKDDTRNKRKLSFLHRDTLAPVGSRNRCTFAAACNMMREGVDDTNAMQRLMFIANGLDEREVRTILDSAKKRAV